METTNTNHTEQSSTKNNEKQMNDTSKEMMDMFTKNLNLTTSFYSNAFNSLSNGNKEFSNSHSSLTNFTNNDFTKMFSNPFNGMGNIFLNQSLPTFESLYKQMMEYNTNLFLMLTKKINTNTDWSEIGKKEEAIIENRLEAIKNMRHSIIEAYTKQLDNTNEHNKNIIHETTEQFNLLMKQNQKLMTDMFVMFQTSQKNEEKSVINPIVSDPILIELKKRSTSPISNHKL